MAAVVESFDPRTGEVNGDPVPTTTDTELLGILASAETAQHDWAAVPASERARMLEDVARELDHHSTELVDLADSETALGIPRLTGEVARTSGQVRMFAELIRSGAHVDAILSPARPDRALPDLRRMLQPIGPVAVFSASNFPFAFSVAGGDTASALAAGCVVVVKAHSAHPLTSIATQRVVSDALNAAGAPDRLVSLVHGREPGTALVSHPTIKAAGFTGSQTAGRALFDLASARPDPIPFYGELGSCNPIVVLPEAADADPNGIAQAYVSSLTLGSGQFCTNPGLLFVPAGSSLLPAIEAAISSAASGIMLTSGMRQAYDTGIAELVSNDMVAELGSGMPNGPTGWGVTARVLQTDAATFAADRKLQDEVFGPGGLVVTYTSEDDLLVALGTLRGSLAAGVHATGEDLPLAGRLRDRLRLTAGRVIFNDWPTGVAVVWAQHHGGPWPATTSSRDTSVGARAIGRWLTPVAYQGWPDALLPAELQDANPLGILRTVQDHPSS
jgi:NADP-dependent aldehyde dehydrogenase